MKENGYSSANDFSPERALIYEARSARLRDATENIRLAIDYFRNPENKAELVNKIAEFDNAISSLNKLMVEDKIEEELYADVADLRDLVRAAELPTLAHMTHRRVRGQDEADELVDYGTIQQTFQDIARLINDGEWEFPKSDLSEHELVSGLLIEGYGLLLKNRVADPDSSIDRSLVKAFEEVLITLQPDSGLLRDVLPWMVEEKDDFPPAIGELITREAAKDRVRKVESEKSHLLAAELANAIFAYAGRGEWVADDPLEARLVLTDVGLGYIFEICKKDDWIAIAERTTDNPKLVKHYNLQRENDAWSYVDPDLKKYGTPSTDQLERVAKLLKAALGTGGKLTEANKRELPPAES